MEASSTNILASLASFFGLSTSEAQIQFEEDSAVKQRRRRPSAFAVLLPPPRLIVEATRNFRAQSVSRPVTCCRERRPWKMSVDAPPSPTVLSSVASFLGLNTVEVSVQFEEDRYEKLLRRARSEDLTEVSGIGCLYQSGVDRLGRPVVVFVGKWFPFSKINLDKALLYLIYLLDPIVKGDYVIAYFHTLTSSSNYPSFTWLREVYNVLPYKYKKNLKAFYVVHPTFWTKMMTWWFTTFMAPAIKQKVHSLPGVEYLYSVMSPDQLEIPAFITEYDMTINGIRYFQPGAPT
ncbi:hypothetical protein GWI33_016381 [Rhynchophorus ferrugineus]|uniref:CRAL-TRIO domain-containing protein n=1 Tax=Rhynchophorus ferrugineus TaxID=354439 RepID=A0A834M8Q9_RHYFE|nr:hypothetical protein GWI33_016381 [Rhynchophorus ferrugineus]